MRISSRIMSEPRSIGDIMRELNERLSSGEPVFSGGFVYIMTGFGVRVFTESEFRRVFDGGDNKS